MLQSESEVKNAKDDNNSDMLISIFRQSYRKSHCSNTERLKDKSEAMQREGMMYQRKKNNKYILPATVYNRTIWLIRDYYRLKEKEKDIIGLSNISLDGMPKGSITGDQTSKQAVKLTDIRSITVPVEEELQRIPEEYREGIWENIIYKRAFPMNADRSTYGRYKSKFIYAVAKRVMFI